MRTILCALFLLTIAANARAADVPQRIISLGSYVTESLYDFGADDRIVGVTTYCVRPPAARDKQKVGSIVDVTIETVLTLRPDLVIATPLTDGKAIASLRAAGIRVEVLPQVRDFEEICAQFVFLGACIGEEARAREIVRHEQEAVARRLPQKPESPPRVFVQVGTKPLFTMNSEFFINDLIERAGAVNIARDARSGIYSREKVIAQDPDVIILATMGTESQDAAAGWERYPAIAAVRNRRVYRVDAYDICSPTPRNFRRAFDTICGLLYEGKPLHADAAAH